jgi:hypothetical protein
MNKKYNRIENLLFLQWVQNIVHYLLGDRGFFVAEPVRASIVFAALRKLYFLSDLSFVLTQCTALRG